MPPKKSDATDYTYRPYATISKSYSRPGSAPWRLSFPHANTFALDFHPIPFRGDATGLDLRYLPRRGKAGTSVLSFFAQEHDSQVLCYANANLTRRDQAGEALQFVEFWQKPPEAIPSGCTLIPRSCPIPSCRS